MRHPEALAAAVLAVDAILRTLKPGILVAGVLDECAHLSTTSLLGGHELAREPVGLMLGAVVGSVLIDADHVPLVLMHHPLESAHDRPVTHSLMTLLAIAALSRVAQGNLRTALLGLGLGTTSHFLRDLATGGIPLVWPLSRRLVFVPYLAYAAVLGACVARARRADRA